MRHILFAIFFINILSINAQATENQSSQYKHPRESFAKKCNECHEMREGKEYFHRPVKQGSCGGCHTVPSSSKNKLRTQDIVAICITCHSSKERLIRRDNNIHPPVKQACTHCHDPHAGEHQFRLKADRKKDICLSCHTEKKAWIQSVKNRHGAIEEGGCIACHDPHGTDKPKMLKNQNTRELCLSCHSTKKKRDEDGKTLMSIGDHLLVNKKWHGPIIVGECTGCHNPHGSNNHRMLKHPYPTTSTTKFAPEKYLCFQCHQTQKITEKFTTTETNFRKGKKNLHYIHVDKSSITCGTCHDFHGVRKNIPLIKDKTTYVGTKFPLRFIKKAEGGSCNPICHKRRDYVRSKELSR